MSNVLYLAAPDLLLVSNFDWFGLADAITIDAPGVGFSAAGAEITSGSVLLSNRGSNSSIQTLRRLYCLCFLFNFVGVTSPKGYLGFLDLPSAAKFKGYTVIPPYSTFRDELLAVKKSDVPKALSIEEILVAVNTGSAITIPVSKMRELAKITNISAALRQFHYALLAQLIPQLEQTTRQRRASIPAGYMKLHQEVLDQLAPIKDQVGDFRDRRSLDILSMIATGDGGKSSQTSIKGAAATMNSPATQAVAPQSTVDIILTELYASRRLKKGEKPKLAFNEIAVPEKKVAKLRAELEEAADFANRYSAYASDDESASAYDLMITLLQDELGRTVEMTTTTGQNQTAKHGYLAPTVVLNFAQLLEPEDHAFLMPFVRMTPCNSTGRALSAGDAPFEPIDLNADIAKFEQFKDSDDPRAFGSRWNLMGTDGPIIGLQQVTIQYANETGPYKTFVANIELQIANPDHRIREFGNPVGHLLRLGKNILLEYGYREEGIRTVVQRIIDREQDGKKTAKKLIGKTGDVDKVVERVVEATQRQSVVQIANVGINTDLPYLWDVTIKAEPIYSRVIHSGFFLGPALDGQVFAQAKSLYHQLEDDINELQVRVEKNEKGQAEKFKNTWLDLAREAERTRKVLIANVIENVRTLIEVYRNPPESLLTADVARIAGNGEVFINLPILMYHLLIPSYVRAAQLVGVGGRPAAHSEMKEGKVKFEFNPQQKFPDYIVDLLSLQLTTVGAVSAIDYMPKGYQDVYVRLGMIEKWLATALTGDTGTLTLGAVYKSFEKQILREPKTYYDWPIREFTLDYPNLDIKSLTLSYPRPTLSFTSRENDSIWTLQLIDLENIVEQLNFLNELEQLKADDRNQTLSDTILGDARAKIVVGTSKSILGNFSYNTTTVNEVANRYVGLASEKLKVKAGTILAQISDLFGSVGRSFDFDAFANQNELSTLIVDIAMSTVSFECPVGLLDMEPQKPLTIDIGNGAQHNFIINSLVHRITRHQIISEVQAYSLISGTDQKAAIVQSSKNSKELG